MTKRPSDQALRDDMNVYARALLKAAYGGIVDVQEGETAGEVPKPDVFNAVTNWIRTDAGMEPAVQQSSGLSSLREGMKRGK